MLIKEPVLCRDGKIRYPRIFVSSLSPRRPNKMHPTVVKNASGNGSHEKNILKKDEKREKFSSATRTRNVVTVSDPAEGVTRTSPRGRSTGELTVPDIVLGSPGDSEISLQEFEKAWSELSEEFYGKKIPFFGNRIRNVKKAMAAYRAVMNAKSLNTDIKMYLRSHFDQAKQNPIVLRPAFLGSKNGIKLYSSWIKKFASKKDALDKICHTDLETLLAQDHKNFLYHKQTMTEYGIFTLMYSQFTHLYLVSCPGFLDILERESGRLPAEFVRNCREVLERLSRQPLDAMKFLKLVEAIKCPEK